MTPLLPATNSEVYRKRAEEVEELARGIRFEHEREAMLKIADQWRAMARDAEIREGKIRP